MKTNDILITNLMSDVDNGKIQLPDFQRGWVWDDNHIRALLASITCNFPVGAAMFLEYGNPNIIFKYRMIEGAENKNIQPPAELILDGQQRLTSIYSTMYCKNPVKTKNDKGKEIELFYYIDIEKALDPSCDRIDAIISVPAHTKQITSNFGKTIVLDLSSPQKEFENKMFPLNIIFDIPAQMQWQTDYRNYYQNHPNFTDIIAEFTKFYTEIIVEVVKYQIPVITLDINTPKEAVCQVFENVNTGGVSLTVFELLTAVFAMNNFDLREDWEKRRAANFSTDILKVITATDFITACTLLKSYMLGQTVSCKKKDVLNLKFAEYQKCADILTEGFKIAEDFIEDEKIFYSRDLPYTSQLIPLAVICTLLAENNLITINANREKLRQWYWCGVFGELYGGANETRYVNDVVDVMNWIVNASNKPKTVEDCAFIPMRLTTLQTRNSAAYKGFMALIMKNQATDFISGQRMDLVQFYKGSGIDIHHIFPQKYCTTQNLDKQKWNSVINKTPLCYSTNREIGGTAPSKYLEKILNSHKNLSRQDLQNYLATHWIEMADCQNDDFDNFIVKRAKSLLDAVENEIGKKISGRDSDEVKNFFGQSV